MPVGELQRGDGDRRVAVHLVGGQDAGELGHGVVHGSGAGVTSAGLRA